MLAARKEARISRNLLQRLAEARAQTDKLFALVRQDSLYDRPIAERHRIIFYIGHLEAFDGNLLRERVLTEKALHPEFDRLFAFGIDPVGGGLPSDQPGDWPKPAEVRDYVSQVRERLDAKLGAETNSAARQEGFSADLLLNVAIEHRLMHAETLAYMLHQLPPEKKIRPVPVPELVARPVTASMVEIRAGQATLGLSYSDNGTFGWDNEYEANVVSVPAFAIDRYKVTNGLYAEFIAAGGYENPDLWTEDDWAWKTEHQILHPAFWKRVNGQWFYRTMFDDVPLPLDWPVYVSHAEASAYARWGAKALPTEAQWHRAASGTPEESERAYPWGGEAPDPRRGNFNFHRWNPTSVGAFPRAQSAFGVADLLGNGWEWTSTQFAPFSGFQPFPFYRGYSADFFDGKHYVLKGGSARTAACMLRRSFRNWFQAHYQYVFAGFRCVSN